MGANRPRHGRKSESRPGPKDSSPAPKWLEEFDGRIVAKAGPTIEDFDREGPLAGRSIDPAGNLDHASDATVEDGVVEEIAKSVFQPRPVDPDELVGHVGA